MNILVLGGNGYLGSKVVKKLYSLGNSNITCTKRNNSDMGRIQVILPNINLIPASVDAIKVAMQYEHFDCVLNMAGNYGRSNMLYDNVIETNVEFPLQVLNAAVEYGVKRFITVGTSLPANLNMYSFSKEILSQFGQFYAEKHNIDFFDIKLEMFYGADEPENRFIPSMIKKMILADEIDVTYGTQKRDIISIIDVVDAISAIIKTNLNGYVKIPLGTGEAPMVRDIINYVWEATGKRSIINWGAIPMRTNEPDCIADIQLISKMLDWNPIYWKDGLSDMIDVIRSERLVK